MKDLFKAFQRIPERNRTVVYGILAFIKNLFYFLFKVIVGIVFKTPLLIAIALYNLLIGMVKANCSRGLWKNKDDVKDCKTYVLGGIILSLSSIFYIVYTLNQATNPNNMKYNTIIAIAIAIFSIISIVVSIIGLVFTKGKTILIQQYKLTNFAAALTNLVLTQVAILSLVSVSNMNFYNTIFGVAVGFIILCLGFYLIIHGERQMKVYTTGITNTKTTKRDN